MSCTRALVVLVSIAAAQVGAQSSPRMTYYSIEAGGAAQQTDEVNLRSTFGVSAALGFGRLVSERVALEARIGGQRFGAPAQTLPPGCPPFATCEPPPSDDVSVTTLGGDVVAILSDEHALAPVVTGGVGARYITAAPVHGGELRPFAEIGGGFAGPVGGVRVSITARFQRAMTSAGLPRWTMPIGLGVDFF
ncbi:MAG: hypothetical protein ACREPM_07565 [Gemmatimonadaceae bacterium]